jgi:predicted dienelactone hydrolase
MDHSRIGAAGHSFGGHTVGLLLGAQVNGKDFSDPRISAGILLAAPGRGGKDMTEENAARFPFFDVDFSTLTTRSLIVCGNADNPHFTTRGPNWHADVFRDAPGAEALLMLTSDGPVHTRSAVDGTKTRSGRWVKLERRRAHRASSAMEAEVLRGDRHGCQYLSCWVAAIRAEDAGIKQYT